MIDSRVFAIINPRSGKHAGNSILLDRFKTSYPGLDYSFPKNAGNTTEVTRQALTDGYEVILAAGGDGTLHNVVNGFFKEDGTLINSRAVMEICPAGTANDFLRTIISDENKGERENNQPCRKYDIGVVQVTDSHGKTVRRYFLNICDLGLGALIASRVNSPPTGKRGLTQYIIEALKCGWSFTARQVNLEMDGRTFTKKIKMIALANGTTFGSGLCIAPEASARDGFLDIVLLGNISYFTGLKYLWSIKKGRKFLHSLVEYHRVKEIKVSSPEKLPVEADGEIIGNTPLHAWLIPQILPLRIYSDSRDINK